MIADDVEVSWLLSSLLSTIAGKWSAPDRTELEEGEESY